MVSRPTSITVIAWFLIGISVLGAAGIVLGFLVPKPTANEVVDESPIPVAIQYGFAFIGTAIDLVSGYFMLRGRNWSRYLYVVWSASHVAVFFWLTSSHRLYLIPGAVITIVIAIFLFVPGANAFFAAGERYIDPRSIPSPRRSAGILFYFFAGFIFTCTGSAALMSIGGGIGKTLMVCTIMLPFAVCLSIGRWLSAEENWRRDVGIVLCVSTPLAAAMAVMIAGVFANPQFNKKIPPEHADLMSDYRFATVWFVAWSLLGVALILASRNYSKQPRIPRPLAR
jgi:hypothetical protein